MGRELRQPAGQLCHKAPGCRHSILRCTPLAGGHNWQLIQLIWWVCGHQMHQLDIHWNTWLPGRVWGSPVVLVKVSHPASH